MLKKISHPVLKELPFFAFFLFLMGIGEVAWKLWYMYHDIPLSGQITLRSLWGAVFIWLAADYFATLIIYKTKPWVKFVFYALLLVMWAIQNFLRMEYGSPISPTYLTLLFETNPEETRGFLKMILHSPNFLYTIKKLALGIALIIFAEWLYKKLFQKVKIPAFGYIALSILLIPIVATGVYSSRRYIQLLNVKSVDNDILLELPRDPFSCTYNALVMLNRSTINTRHFINVSTSNQGATISGETDKALNLVLIIGESYNKYHAQLYGYPKETTPFMSHEQEAGRLFPFYDVCAPSNMTSVVMKNALSTNSMGNGEEWYDYPYVLTLFHEAGYDVYFWDNQRQDVPQGSVEFSLHSILYNTILSERSYSCTNEKAFRYDMELVEDFISTVDTVAVPHNLFLFHLMGQHFTARSRYPNTPDNTVFTTSDYPDRYPFYTETVKQSIAEYDNATLYNDKVIERIINCFLDTNAIVIYFSDHADEVYDYRNHISRDQGEMTPDKLKYQYDVPFVIWYSDEYLSRHPKIAEKTIHAQNKPFETDNLPHLLISLGGIDTQYYMDNLNVLDSSYNCPPRVLFESSETYDTIINSQH